MDYSTFIDALYLALDHGEESISLGGGEPTLHPRFFDMIRTCFQYELSVWLATNGSRKKAMFRLHDIIQGDDPEICMRNDYSLCVALSTDYHHDYNMVDHSVRELWNKKAGRSVPFLMRDHRYECRDVTASYDGPVKAGRAARTGAYGIAKGCVCTELFIHPDGSVTGCGCKDAPLFGNVSLGVTIPDDWDTISCSHAECNKGKICT